MLPPLMRSDGALRKGRFLPLLLHVPNQSRLADQATSWPYPQCREDAHRDAEQYSAMDSLRGGDVDAVTASEQCESAIPKGWRMPKTHQNHIKTGYLVHAEWSRAHAFAIIQLRVAARDVTDVLVYVLLD